MRLFLVSYKPLNINEMYYKVIDTSDDNIEDSLEYAAEKGWTGLGEYHVFTEEEWNNSIYTISLEKQYSVSKKL